MQYLREQESKVTIKVDPKDSSAVRQAQKIAADTNSDIELKKEQSAASSVNLSTVAKELRGLMEEALRQSGMEVSVSSIGDVTNDSFTISIEHPNDNVETYTFTVNPTNILSISSKDYLGGEVVELGEIGVKASGEPIVNREIIKSELVSYFSATPLSTDPDAETDLHALKNYDDVEAGITQERVARVKALQAKLLELKKAGKLTLEHKQKIQKIVSSYRK